MARTNLADVKVILPTSTVLTDPQITAAIDAAMCVVDQIVLTCGATLPLPCLEQIEKYLSAHFAAATENTLSLASEKDGCCGGSVTYGFKFGQGILGTPFGQMANTLSQGCLLTTNGATNAAGQVIEDAQLHTLGCH